MAGLTRSLLRKYLGVFTEDKDKNKPFCAAVDFDDKDYVSHDWNMLPPSMSVVKETKSGKKVNQRIYKVNGQGFVKFDYGGGSKEAGKLVETLQSGFSYTYTRPGRLQWFLQVKLIQRN